MNSLKTNVTFEQIMRHFDIECMIMCYIREILKERGYCKVWILGRIVNWFYLFFIIGFIFCSVLLNKSIIYIYLCHEKSSTIGSRQGCMKLSPLFFHQLFCRCPVSIHDRNAQIRCLLCGSIKAVQQLQSILQF